MKKKWNCEKKRSVAGLGKRLALLGVGGCMLVSLAGCGMSDTTAAEIVPYKNSFTEAGSYSATADQVAEFDGGEYEYTEETTTTVVEPGSDTSVATNRKLVQTVDLTVETENFEELNANVEKRITALGGYVEQAYTYNGSAYSTGKIMRYATITIRLPEEKLSVFVDEVSSGANVISKTTSTEDVTLQYVDTQGLKEMYLAEEKSLLALLEQAESVEDISFLVSELSTVRYEIEHLESRLRTYDNLVDYATVNLRIDEVEVLTPLTVEEKTFWQEVTEGTKASFLNLWNGFLSFIKGIIIVSPYLIPVVIVIGVFVLAIRLIIVIIKKAIAKGKTHKKAEEEVKQ